MSGINYDDKILKKIKDIPNHKSMRRDERIKYHAENQLFDLDDTIVIDNLSILLIDDVKTTSTTFQDCVKQLAKGSPKKILCMAAAETYY